MIRVALCAISLISLMPMLAHGASLEDYESRLQKALTTLRAATVRGKEAALDRLVTLIPPEEKITFGNHTLKVNNTWVHDSVRAFGAEPNLTKRQEIYTGIQNRLAALLEEVQRARQSVGEDHHRERQQLAEILSQKEFQQHQTETWMSRFRDWVGQALDRLFRLFPRWQRSEGPFSRWLEILVWLLAAAVLYILIRTIFVGFRREKRMKPSGQPVILGTVIEPQATAGDLRNKALELARQSDYREAVRYLYISLLYELQERGWLQLDAALTNGEYLRRLRSAVTIYPLMLYLTRRFDQFWYGQASPSESEYQEFLDQYQTALSTLTSQ